MNPHGAVSGLAHVNMRGPARMIEQLRRFYIETIGLRDGPRPRFRSGSHGYWLYAGETDVVHLSIDPLAPADGTITRAATTLDHIALRCHGLAQAIDRLREAGVEYHVDRVDDMAQVQLFLIDPGGTRLELNFTGEDLPG